tara:strand:- start:1670 stop:2533 length:864 start_codon:yes stop_codon:yes gene_type:complete
MANQINIKKTRKLYINGKFPRSESERYIAWISSDNSETINIARASRKDFRDSVRCARGALTNWKNKTAYNRGQIIYRMAEMMESRKEQLIRELILGGAVKNIAKSEVETTIDYLVYYAGWADKYQQIFSCVNPVAQPFFSFTVPEPTGVVSVLCPNQLHLKYTVSVLSSIILSGNTAVLLYSEDNPLPALTLAEIIHTSDVPPGVINILTGKREELLEQFASHMDVNAVIYCGENQEEIKTIQKFSSVNVKRCHILKDRNLENTLNDGPYTILRTVEMKTTWHPVGI